MILLESAGADAEGETWRSHQAQAGDVQEGNPALKARLVLKLNF